MVLDKVRSIKFPILIINPLKFISMKNVIKNEKRKSEIIGKIYFIISLDTFINLFSCFLKNPEWINYTNSDVVLILAADGNEIWAGTNGGLVKLDIRTDSIIFYNKTHPDLPCNSIIAVQNNLNLLDKSLHHKAT